MSWMDVLHAIGQETSCMLDKYKKYGNDNTRRRGSPLSPLNIRRDDNEHAWKHYLCATVQV